MQKSSLVLAICLCPLLIGAQATLTADSNRVETGNPLGFSLRVPTGGGLPDSIDFRNWPADNVIKQSEWLREDGFFQCNFTLLLFDEDTLQLPPLPVALRNGDTVYTNAIDIVVYPTPSPDDLNDMTPIKDIHREESRWSDYLPWLFGALMVIGLLWLLKYLSERKPKSSLTSRSIETPPHELALKKLEQLSRKQWIAQGAIKAHYAELTYIVREYLERKYHIPALESTTEDTLKLLSGLDFPASQLPYLRQLLEQADLAKFARIIPSESFHVESFAIAKKIVSQV